MKLEIDGVKAGEDLEYVHRMRVASRRMRSALTLFSSCFNKQRFKEISKDVRAVTRSLGEARDTDVQLEALAKEAPKFSSRNHAPGFKRLVMRLEQKRQAQQAKVISSMEQLEKDGVLEKIAETTGPLAEQAGSVYLYSPGLYAKAFDGIQNRLEELYSHEKFIYDPTNVAELHAMRISAKRLRYSLEAFEELYGEPLKPYISEVKKLQDVLGWIHDLDVWTEMIPVFIEEERQRILIYFGHDRPLKRLLPGLKAFAEQRRQLREAAYLDFLHIWIVQNEEGTWEALKKLIATPIDLEKAVQQGREAEPDETGAA